MPKLLVKTDISLLKNPEKGYIIAGTLPDKNLTFKNVFQDGNFKYTIVEGILADINQWMARVGAVIVLPTDLNLLAKPKVEVSRKCFNCGQLYTPKWVDIVL